MHRTQISEGRNHKCNFFLYEKAVCLRPSFLHLVDDYLYVGGADFPVAVEVVFHVLLALILLHLVDEHLNVGGADLPVVVEVVRVIW